MQHLLREKVQISVILYAYLLVMTMIRTLEKNGSTMVQNVSLGKLCGLHLNEDYA